LYFDFDKIEKSMQPPHLHGSPLTISTEAARRAIAHYDIIAKRCRIPKPDSLMKKAVKERKRKAKWNF
jgi:rubrerythrin